MLNSLWKIIAWPLGWIMFGCYWLTNDVLHLDTPGVAWAYILALFLFVIITKALLFPLSLKQQRSTAMMQAYKPMMDEIQKKYANDKQRQQQELAKLQQEYGYNPMAGCLPLLIQFPLIFGLIEVIYNPLTHMLRIDKTVLTAMTEAAKAALGDQAAARARLIETTVIESIKGNPNVFSSIIDNSSITPGMYNTAVEAIEGFQMNIGSINLWETPGFVWSLALLIPIFSIVTMIGSQIATMAINGNLKSQGRQMWIMTLLMTAMFGYFSFSFPAGFSLYWGLQNIVAVAQAFILKKVCNPEKYREEVQAKIEAQKKSVKKATKKVVTVVDEQSGEVIERELSLTDLEKLRLQRARELDEERYR